VGVVFHLLLHEELFGKTKEELLIEAEEVAPLQRKDEEGVADGGGGSSPPTEKRERRRK
jgi:hypothetical protein